MVSLMPFSQLIYKITSKFTFESNSNDSIRFIIAISWLVLDLLVSFNPHAELWDYEFHWGYTFENGRDTEITVTGEG